MPSNKDYAESSFSGDAPIMYTATREVRLKFGQDKSYTDETEIHLEADQQEDRYIAA